MYYEMNPRKGTPEIEMVGDPMPNQVSGVVFTIREKGLTWVNNHYNV